MSWLSTVRTLAGETAQRTDTSLQMDHLLHLNLPILGTRNLKINVCKNLFGIKKPFRTILKAPNRRRFI